MAITYTKMATDAPVWEYIARANEDGTTTVIPIEPANSDYQAYLAYVANGNTLPSESSTPQAGK